MRRPAVSALALLALSLVAADEPPLPAVPEGFAVELVAAAPAIRYPTAVVARPDGTVFLGQDPMDMPGPPTEPIDSVVAIRPDGSIVTFADQLWAVMGLEWVDDALIVVHAPFLSAFRDTDGDLVADERIDLMTGLGPELPGFSGINDHVASGVELGMDGFLYISVGDKGIPRGVGRDGSTITLKGGGVIRIRPDGTDLQVVSTGERNPLSAMLTTSDDVFTYGNDDDSKKWPNSLTHHIVGGHYGYPYEFLLEPGRCLPIVAGQIGGSGTQGIVDKETGLPERYRGDLFVCDWGLQRIDRIEVKPAGGTYRLAGREPFITAGDVPDFRPFSIAPTGDGRALLVVDWGVGNWLLDGPPTGRLYRVSYVGPDAPEPVPVPEGVAALDHPSHAARLRSQRALAERGEAAVAALVARLDDREHGTQGRLHALWALDAIGTPEAAEATRAAIADADPSVRAQAARRAGVRRDAGARPAVERLLDDPDAVARREAAVALGLIGDPAAGPALMAHLGDPDPFVSWSVRHAVRSLKAWDEDAILAALNDPGRRGDALKLTDEAWAVPVAEALAKALTTIDDPGARAVVVDNLAGIFLAYPEWDGAWFGTNPLAGSMPRKTERWETAGMRAVLGALIDGLDDPDPKVRGRAIVGIRAAGPAIAPALRARLEREDDAENLRALALVLGDLADAESAPALGRLALDAGRPIAVREAALDALGHLRGPEPLRRQFSLVFDPGAPGPLVARALPGLAKSGVLPPNDLASFLGHEDPDVRVAALRGLAGAAALPDYLGERIAAGLDDPAPAVRAAAAAAVAAIGHRAAVPRLVAMAGSDVAVRGAVVRALAAIPDERAIPTYLDALRDRSPDLRRSAESALLALGDAARPRVEAFAASETLDGPAAMAVERVLTRFRPITDWRVIGPFARTTARVFLGEPAIDFDETHSGVEGRTIAWESRRGDPATGRVVIDDYKEGRGDLGGFGYDATGSPDLAAFAFAEITSESDRDALLLIGSSGSLIVELNGEAVHAFSEYAGRPYAPDSDRVRVRLKAGTNRLLMRVRQGIGAWSFGVQVSEPGGAAIAPTPSAGVEALRSYALAHDGDPARGAAIFFAEDGVGCAKCHAAAGRGTADVGPDLSGLITKYDRAEIIRSVLEPSARIATGYQPVLVATDDGRVIAGVVREETAAELVLADAEAATLRVPKTSIEERRLGEASIMPGGLADALSPAEFADLVAFLMTLDASPAGGTTPAAEEHE